MTDTDKTKEKLVNSIRKTKASAGADKAETPSPEQDAAPRPNTKDWAPTPEDGNFSSGRRVWPD